MSAGRVSEESCAPPSKLGGGGPKHNSCRTVLGKPRMRSSGVSPTQRKSIACLATNGCCLEKDQAKSKMSRPTEIPLRLDQLIALNDEIVALTRSGIPLEFGLEKFGDTQRETLANITSRLAARMSGGESLADALDKEGKTFPPAYRRIVQAGLKAGRLPIALQSVSDHAGMILALREMIGRAMIYPMLIVTLAYALLIVFTFDLFERFRETVFDGQLPMGNGLRIGLGMLDNVWLWIWIPPITILLLCFAWQRTSRGQLTSLDGYASLLRLIPGLQKISYFARCAAFADLLGTLVANEVPLDESLILAGQTSGHPAIAASAKSLARICQQVDDSASQDNRPEGIPPYLRWQILQADRRGDLTGALHASAENYMRRAQQLAASLRIFFPIFVAVLIGGGVTFMYGLSTFLPLVELLHSLAW